MGSDAAWQLQYYYRRRAVLIEYLGGQCAVCGTADELHIDHIDPARKSFNITYTMSLKDPLLIAELAKCQLLCRRHHHKKTARENSGFTHGTCYGWMHKRCRCALCSQWNELRKQRRRIPGGRGARGPYNTESPVCGTLRAYRRGCRCEACRAANTEEQRRYRGSRA